MRGESEMFLLDAYARHPAFSSFLPGIAGTKGIPIWCYYVNRGQAVASFGVDNKDHAILEFLPAHRAYETVGRRGFRTFLRRDGRTREAFTDASLGDMRVEMNALHLEEEDAQSGLRTQVDYFVLPEERLGALVRRVRITNIGARACALEVLDGLAELIPYGVGDGTMKNMLQTGKAWMQAEDADGRVPYFRVRASMDDTTRVGMVEGGNFAIGLNAAGEPLPVIVDAEAVFSYDTALNVPHVFVEEGLDGVEARRQRRSNLLPCALFALRRELGPGESVAVNEVIGQVERRELLLDFLKEKLDGGFFDAKHARARELTRALTDPIDTHTGVARFDAYCRYTFMDNVLRGGMPLRLGGDKVFYVYSRKHGDLERDYNYFRVSPEFYSQGNGSYRDVNQNRRSDTFFYPFVGRRNLHTFLNLIQLDGYNPLGVERTAYAIAPDAAARLTEPLPEDIKEEIASVLANEFTPGKLYATLCARTGAQEANRLFGEILSLAEERQYASFGEGYWCDHWTYNLDLIEEYLSVFPEEERELLYAEEYRWFAAQVKVMPRARRYVETEDGVRQYRALEDVGERGATQAWLRDREGRIVRGTLFEKLCLMCAVKFATLDPCGMGIEMEGGKPGWYDALNGLPGILGSSVAETCELTRLMEFTISALERNPGQVELLAEVAELMDAVRAANRLHSADLRALDELSEPNKPGEPNEPGEANGLDEPNEFYEPNKPGEPNGLDEPDEPDEPDESGILDEPDEPCEPDEPDEPGEEVAALGFWNAINDAKENYRSRVYAGVSGRRTVRTSQALSALLRELLDTVRRGIERAGHFGSAGGSVYPTYFHYEVTAYDVDAGGIHPTRFALRRLPAFLEGPVHLLKLNLPFERKRALYERVRASELYDRKLSMYRVNASLEKASYELGRARAFTPGWLENASIWLHMEYKYLLELLRAGLYGEFFRDFRTAAVPFLDPERYGRSTLENSSFIASSANPDERIHGRGFVARLSGSTAEFLSIWRRMMFGERPFTMEADELVCRFAPAIPAYLIGDEPRISATFLGSARVTYHLPDRMDCIPGNYRIESADVRMRDSTSATVQGGVLRGALARALRDGAVECVEIALSRN